MEEIIQQRNVIHNIKPNMKIEKRLLKNTNDGILKKYAKIFIIQSICCFIVIIGLGMYKNVNYQEYQEKIKKYNWLITYDFTYNHVIIYLNEKFKFNIPLKDNNKNIINENAFNNDNINEEIIEDSIIDIKEEQVVQVSTSYDNMKIMAEDMKSKYEFKKPTNGIISCKFGNRESSNKEISKFHLGLDIANDIGTEIVSAMEGIVKEVSSNNTYGKYIKVVKDDVLIVYAHCSKILVKENTTVKMGQKIALMGQTGNATGPHLHFEVRKNGLVINPEYLINFR